MVVDLRVPAYLQHMSKTMTKSVSFLFSHMIRSIYSLFIKSIMGKYFSVNHPLPYKLPNTDPVCSSAFRKRTKQPDLPTWPPLSPGDWPVLQTLTRRKTGEASESVALCKHALAWAALLPTAVCCRLAASMLCMVCVAWSYCFWLCCHIVQHWI